MQGEIALQGEVLCKGLRNYKQQSDAQCPENLHLRMQGEIALQGRCSAEDCGTINKEEKL